MEKMNKIAVTAALALMPTLVAAEEVGTPSFYGFAAGISAACMDYEGNGNEQHVLALVATGAFHARNTMFTEELDQQQFDGGLLAAEIMVKDRGVEDCPDMITAALTMIPAAF